MAVPVTLEVRWKDLVEKPILGKQALSKGEK